MYIIQSLYFLTPFLKKVARRIPIVLYVHCPYSYGTLNFGEKIGGLKIPIAKILEGRIYKYADLIKCNSLLMTKFMRASFGVEAKLLYPPVGSNYFKPDWRQKEENNILSVLNLNPYKGPHVMIELFKKHFSDDRLVAGNLSKHYHSYYQYLLKLVKGYERTISIIPNVSDDELKELYEKATIFWYVFTHGHLELTPVEAMGASVPVIAMYGDGVKETVKNFETGFLVSSVREFVKYTKYSLQNPDIILKMGERAKRYDWDHRVDSLCDILTRINI